MSDDLPADHISLKRAVLAIAGMDRAVVRKDMVYRTTGAGPLTMDVYYPADATPASLLPAVVIVSGYNDVGFERVFGCRFKEMAMSVSWGQLIAVSGMVAIAYTNREPVADLDALLHYVRQHAAGLGIDDGLIGLWSCSGSVPLALSALMGAGQDFVRCAALLYGYTIDLEGATGVADAAQTYRFANPNAGRSIDDVPQGVPLFLVRAGQDQFARLNESIERFVAAAVARNIPLTFVNHATGPHSFDLLQDTEPSREIIRDVLRFLQSRLAR